MSDPQENPYQSPPGKQDEGEPVKTFWRGQEIFGAVLGIAFLTTFLMAFLGYSPSEFLAGASPPEFDLMGMLGRGGFAWIMATCLFLSGLAWMLGWGKKK